MAVDYYHYLLVSGSHAAVREFVHRIALVVDRRVAGTNSRQIVPFSFESLYTMAAIKGDGPGEAFDMSRWRVVRRGRSSEVRYRFHTRSVELHPLLKRLSKKTPRLLFALVTHCLDDNDFGQFAIRKGVLRGGWLGDQWREPFWELTSKRFKMPLDECYEDPQTEMWAEDRMRDAALELAIGSPRRFSWAGGQTFRRYEDERGAFMTDLAERLNAMASGAEE